MTDESQKNADQLVADLESSDAIERGRARRALVQIGAAAVPPLLKALDASKQHVRWEAAKSLTEISDPSTTGRLIVALGDKDSDVRWVVAEALIALGRDGVKPLLLALTESDPPEGLYEGAHHILRDLAKKGDVASVLEPVIKAFGGSEPGAAVPVAAADALKSGGI